MKIKFLGTTSRAKMAHPHLSVDSFTLQDSDSGMWVSLVRSVLMFGWASLLFDITVCCSDCSSVLMSWRHCSSVSLSINTAAVCEDFSIWPILSQRF